MTRLVRQLRRRPPFSAALVTLVVGVTALTAVAIGGLAWHQHREHSRVILDTAMAQTAALTAAHAERFLRHAESAARLGPQLVRAGQLDVADANALERFALAVLRANPQLSWVSYGDRDDRFVGVWRDGVGQMYANRSFPRRGRIRLEEDRLLADGRRAPVRRADDHGYRPSERPYFALAAARREVAWTPPYEFYAGGGLGVTCAAPLLDERGGVRGVFTVDFSLDRLGDFLDAVQVSRRGHVYLATRAGTLLVGQRDRRQPADAVLAATVRALLANEDATTFAVDHDGERYLGRTAAIDLSGLGWLVQVVVPERDYTESTDVQARWAIGLGLVALLLAVAGGSWLAHWIAQPLRELAEAARAIRRGRLDVSVIPRSRDEIGVLTRAIAEMARALRDREHIRDALARYVSRAQAERVLRDRGALRLGGELREVVILMSDIRGFSELSEALGPEAMIDLLNRYLARMTRVVLEHGGMIDEFIGDGILVLFGVDDRRPDDADRAVHCASAMQDALRALNEEHRALGFPPLAMGIGVHFGRVVAGHIGGDHRVKYGVVGPAVNVTARIQALTAGGEALVSDAVLARLSAPVEIGPPWSVQVKGSASPVTVHRLVAAPGAAG